MRRNVTLFTEPKKEPLFTVEVELDPYNDNLDHRCEEMSVTFDGSVYNDLKQYVGKIPAEEWKYVRQFDKPEKIKRTGYNRFTIEVFCELDGNKIFPDPHDHPYAFRCSIDGYPCMASGQEYYCDLVDQEDRFDVMLDDKKIGELTGDKIKKLRGMLKAGYQATAQMNMWFKRHELYLIVRKV